MGFELRIPLSTFDLLKGKREVCLFTHLHVREDEHRLYGFATSAERDLFRLLISATGVGPSIALGALSALSPGAVIEGIAAGDLKSLQRIKGVGKKLAERMVLELRDRVGTLFSSFGLAIPPPATAAAGLAATGAGILNSPGGADALLALVSLGFDRKSAEALVIEKHEFLVAAGREIDAEALIKEALRSVR